MKWKKHPILEPRNMLELLFQSPIWVIIYGSGIVFPLVAFTWLIYGLGWHISPKLYPLPHTALLELFAEYLIWVRADSGFSKKKVKIILILVSAICLLGIPLFFIFYFKFLFWAWFGESLAWYVQFFI
jgi:hypothetical protein